MVTCSQSRMLVNHIVKLHAEYHSEQLRKGFEGVLAVLCVVECNCNIHFECSII